MSWRDWFEATTPASADVDYETVTVQKGDSLWAIAEELTGDGNKWQELASANADKGWDKDYTIQPGEVLNVPKSWNV